MPLELSQNELRNQGTLSAAKELWVDTHEERLLENFHVETMYYGHSVSPCGSTRLRQFFW